jgi:hypothetical protein
MHTQTVGDRGIYIEGFCGNALALFIGHGAQSTHVMQAVSQFDQNNPDIPGHSQGHLLEVLRLGLRTGTKLDLSQLADAIDQLCYIVAELLGKRILGDTGIFYDIVKHSGHQALMVEFQAGKNMSNGKGMGYITIATFAHLAFVGLLGVIVGPSHLINAIGIQIGTELTRQPFYRSIKRHRASVIFRFPTVTRSRNKKTRMHASGPLLCPSSNRPELLYKTAETDFNAFLCSTG